MTNLKRVYKYSSSGQCNLFDLKNFWNFINFQLKYQIVCFPVSRGIQNIYIYCMFNGENFAIKSLWEFSLFGHIRELLSIYKNQNNWNCNHSFFCKPLVFNSTMNWMLNNISLLYKTKQINNKCVFKWNDFWSWQLMMPFNVIKQTQQRYIYSFK